MDRRFRIVDDVCNDRVLLCEEIDGRDVVVLDAASIELAQEAAAWLSCQTPTTELRSA